MPAVFGPPGSGEAGPKLCARDENCGLTFYRAKAKRQVQSNKITTIVKEFAILLRNAELAGAIGVDAHGVNGYLGEVA
jgi:2,4-dienoyl-CoA reductase-like NADH-dependent reductase (Old Yellow Enzyme family)